MEPIGERPDHRVLCESLNWRKTNRDSLGLQAKSGLNKSSVVVFEGGSDLLVEFDGKNL